MATEQYFHEYYDMIKQEEPSADKWISTSPVADDESETDKHSHGFDCNICLEMVKDPVITLCGHLYCWPCIYKWIHYHNTSSEYYDKTQPQCPVCKTQVLENTLVPLFGRGQSAKHNSQGKAPDVGIIIPQRPSSRCGLRTPGPTQQLSHRRHHHHQQQQPQQHAMPGLGGMPMPTVVSPMNRMLGEMVYSRIFGNSQALYIYPNSYSLAGMSTQRGRRQAMQAERSLFRLCFFFSCCIVLCLLLF